MDKLTNKQQSKQQAGGFQVLQQQGFGRDVLPNRDLLHVPVHSDQWWSCTLYRIENFLSSLLRAYCSLG